MAPWAPLLLPTDRHLHPVPPLPQALQLRRLALYFDTDAAFWEPGAPWHDLAPHAWDDWFAPGIRWGPGGACCGLAVGGWGAPVAA